MPRDKVVKKIEFELDQIDNLLERYDDLLRKSRTEDIDDVELAALASIIHSYFNGVENIFLLVAKNIDGIVPEGANWHRDLINQMSRETDERDSLISEELKLELVKYLAFRHFYRHSYSFKLDWDEMKDLVMNIMIIEEKFRKEIENFLEKYSK